MTAAETVAALSADAGATATAWSIRCGMRKSRYDLRMRMCLTASDQYERWHLAETDPRWRERYRQRHLAALAMAGAWSALRTGDLLNVEDYRRIHGECCRQARALERTP